MSLIFGNQFTFSPNTVGRALINASGLHLTQTRNSDLGFALAFPFSSTSLTVSGFETFGDNQFATPITFFPSTATRKSTSSATTSAAIAAATPSSSAPTSSMSRCSAALSLQQRNPLPVPPEPHLLRQQHRPVHRRPKRRRHHLQPWRRLLAERPAHRLLRAGLLAAPASHHPQLRPALLHHRRPVSRLRPPQTQNPAYLTLNALGISLLHGAPQDDRKQIAPRIGLAYAHGANGTTVLRGGFGLYFNDLAQNGWATALQAVNTPAGPCVDPVANPTGSENAGCVPGAANGGSASIIDPGYHTPYAIHFSGGVQHAFSRNWSLSADYVHEQGNHAYRGYSYTAGVNLFTPQFPTYRHRRPDGLRPQPQRLPL